MGFGIRGRVREAGGYVIALVLTGAASAQGTPAPLGVPSQFEHAARLIEAGEWAQAERALRALLRSHPGHAGALHLLGIATLKQERPEEAELWFRKAIAAQPSFIAPYLNLGRLLRERGDGAATIRVLRQGLARAPQDAALRRELAAALADQGNFPEAIRTLQAIPPTQRFEGYWEMLGRLQISQGDFTQAEESLRRALDGKPDSVNLLRQLAGVALKRGERGRAWQYMARAARLAPNSPDLLYEYGQVSLQNGLAREAVVALRRALLMEPDRPELLLALGNALLETPDYYEALPHFERYVALRPEDPQGRLALGWSLFLKKSFPEARRQFEEVLRLDPNQADAYVHLGMIAYESGDNAEALEMLTRALKHAPEHPKAHYGLGLVYSRERRYQEARSELETAAGLDPDEPKIYYQLSQVYARLGDAGRARQALERYREAQKKSEERIKLSQQLPSLTVEPREVP